jgi:WD40 repeat protein
MKYKLLSLVALLLPISSSAFGMELMCKVLTVDNKRIDITKDFVQAAQTLKHLIEDTTLDTIELSKDSNIQEKDLIVVIDLFNTSTNNNELTHKLNNFKLEDLSTAITNINYLDIKALFDPAIAIFIDKISSKEILDSFKENPKLVTVAFSSIPADLQKIIASKQLNFIDKAVPSSFTTLVDKPDAGLITSLSFSYDSKRLACSTFDAINILDINTGTTIGQPIVNSSYLNSLTYSPNSHYLASCYVDGTIKIWDANTQKIAHVIKGHDSSVYSLNYSSNGRYLASGSWDNTIKIWDTNTWTLVRTLEGHAYAVEVLSYSPDTRYLASGSLDDTIKIWNASTGELIHTISDHNNSIKSLSYSPDGQHLASPSSFSKVIRIYNSNTWKQENSLNYDKSSSINSLSYSPDGRFLAIGSYSDVRIWRPNKNQLLYTIDVNPGAYTQVSYSPNGKYLAIGSTSRLKVIEFTFSSKETENHLNNLDLQKALLLLILLHAVETNCQVNLSPKLLAIYNSLPDQLKNLLKSSVNLA